MIMEVRYDDIPLAVHRAEVGTGKIVSLYDPVAKFVEQFSRGMEDQDARRLVVYNNYVSLLRDAHSFWS